MLEQFDKCLRSVNLYLKFLGLHLESKDTNKTFVERSRSHRLYFAHLFSLNLEVVAQVLWVLEAVITGKSFVEITRLIPCLILCLISNFKTLSLLYYGRHNNEFIVTMRSLLLNQMQVEEKEHRVRKNLIDKHVLILTSISKKISYVIVLGLLMFALAPAFIIIPHYFKTDEVKLEMPFIAYYPFNEFDLRIYPWVYFHQVYSAVIAMIMVYGPDCFFFTCCTFIHIQFSLLNNDMERIVTEESPRYDKTKFKKLAVRHIELMRCVNLLEKIFSKSILFNALTSSVIICVTGFNVLVVDNIVMMASFTAFLIFGLMQIFLYCYYGDTIMRSSMEVSTSIYNSLWYNIPAADRKGFLIVIIRAQKPCALTANGFFKMNLSAFASILSKSWSYFALLKTMYHPE
ncbi:odorant receptor 4-like isoform X1 [Helicoverpa zea]|uniref:odorant receptor 4-like isoform X1 n=1 Tax=Helicoverpa zea TaxID=7113 RepID=UPI001F5AA605|nr:odorant receptor 4-like isoform X1 [Helicoverpa zea]